MSSRYENLSFGSIDHSDSVRYKRNKASCDALLKSLTRHHGDSIDRLAEAQAARQRAIQSSSARRSPKRRKPAVTAATILANTVRASGYSKAELTGPGRMKDLTYWRHIAVWLLHKRRKSLSFPGIGLIMNRDHSTIIHGINKVRDNYDQYEADIERVEALL